MDEPGNHVFFIESLRTAKAVREAIRARLGPIQIQRMFYKRMFQFF